MNYSTDVTDNKNKKDFGFCKFFQGNKDKDVGVLVDDINGGTTTK